MSPTLYGLMTEEINLSYDGGLYAELIQNRAFLGDVVTLVFYWPVVNDADATTVVTLHKLGKLHRRKGRGMSTNGPAAHGMKRRQPYSTGYRRQ